MTIKEDSDKLYERYLAVLRGCEDPKHELTLEGTLKAIQGYLDSAYLMRLSPLVELRRTFPDFAWCCVPFVAAHFHLGSHSWLNFLWLTRYPVDNGFEYVVVAAHTIRPKPTEPGCIFLKGFDPCYEQGAILGAALALNYKVIYG